MDAILQNILIKSPSILHSILDLCFLANTVKKLTADIQKQA